MIDAGQIDTFDLPCEKINNPFRCLSILNFLWIIKPVSGICEVARRTSKYGKKGDDAFIGEKNCCMWCR